MLFIRLISFQLNNVSSSLNIIVCTQDNFKLHFTILVFHIDIKNWLLGFTHNCKWLPGCPWYVLRIMFSVNVDIIDAKNILQVKLWFQKLLPSSKLNNTPPKKIYIYFDNSIYFQLSMKCGGGGERVEERGRTEEIGGEGKHYQKNFFKLTNTFYIII